MLYELKENERWIKDLVGRYFVTSDGEIYSLLRKGEPKKMLPATLKGRLVNYLCYLDGVGEVKYIHRLVAEVWVPNPDNKPLVRHKNGNLKDNRAKNLIWATYSEAQTITMV